jgi:heparan-alpha-glucosaminide N-acetyltransferase
MDHAISLPSRIASVDMLRAVTMVLMIFVNDLWSLHHIPEWLEHVSADADGMGLADTVFPAFLFIVGMSLPFAIDSRILKGDSTFELIKHIVIRSFALIVMGVFLVNGENINEAATGFGRLLWNVASCVSFILIWNRYPGLTNKFIIRGAQVAGWFILVTLAWLYKAGDGNDIHGFATYWWGILGLIGWAYLVAGIGFVLVQRQLGAMIILWIAFCVLCAFAHLHLLPENRILQMVISPIGEGSMPAFVIGGVIVSLIYKHRSSDKKLLLTFVLIAISLLVLGFATRPLWGISKIRSTPSWVWICSAITIFGFIIMYWVADMRKNTSWFTIIKPAGTSTLLCYLIPYFAYAIWVWTGLHFPDFILTGVLGLVKSFLFALLVVFIAGKLSERGVQLKL